MSATEFHTNNMGKLHTSTLWRHFLFVYLSTYKSLYLLKTKLDILYFIYGTQNGSKKEVKLRKISLVGTCVLKISRLKTLAWPFNPFMTNQSQFLKILDEHCEVKNLVLFFSLSQHFREYLLYFECMGMCILNVLGPRVN